MNKDIWMPVEPWALELLMKTITENETMDQFELMQVRDTLDSVVQGPHDMDDVIAALDVVESYIESVDQTAETPEAVNGAHYNGTSNDG